MLAQVSCPACQFKLSIPEGDMGKRQVCPNCQSPFFAGKTEAPAARNPPPGSIPSYQKTMLANTGPPIKFNCPRCQAPLEVPSIEAGIKKPCPACGQRLQVPAAPPPPPASAQPNLNKTMLAADESAPPAPPIKYNCPSCKKPLESPASEGGTKKPCPACGQRLQVPAAPPRPLQPNPNKTMLASEANGPQAFGGQPGFSTPTAPGAAPGAPAPAGTGQITIGSLTLSKRTVVLGVVGAISLLLVLSCGGFCIVPAVLRGGKADDAAAAAAHEKEVQKATEELEQKKKAVEELNKFQSDVLAKLARQEDTMRENHRDQMRGVTDQNQRAEMQRKQDAERAKLEQDKRQMEQDLQKKLAEAKAEAEKAQKAQQTIIQQAPPVYYYPPYHWRYYYW